MGLFNRKETGCVFSGFEGQLFYEGQPAAGAVLTRKYELFGREGEDTATADSDGRFEFESVFWEYREPLLTPTGFLVHQQIFVFYQKETIQIWGGGKLEKEEFSEFNGVPKNLSCEVLDEAHRVATGRHSATVTNCKWNN